jgi:hypothetical protein
MGPRLAAGRGGPGWQTAFATSRAPGRSGAPQADEYLELDGERVLVLDHFRGRGKTSGLEVREMRTEGAVLFHVRGDKVTRVVVYWDRERALADLGLAPQPGTPGS